MMKSVQRFMRRRQTRMELQRLTDRELHDLGINRGDIPGIVRQVV